MADRDPEQDNLFKEIDEDLRQQKYATLWKNYGKFIIGAAIVLVVGVASVKGWEAYDLNRRSEDSKMLSSALKSIARDKPDTAASILETLAKKGSPGYAVLAQFNQAAVLAKKGEVKAASAAYLELSGDTNIEKIVQDMALIMAALHGVDTGDTEIQHRQYYLVETVLSVLSVLSFLFFLYSGYILRRRVEPPLPSNAMMTRVGLTMLTT